MPKDKEGNKLTWKEFGDRWKKGIEGVTELQQLKAQVQGTYISILGIIFGIIVSAISYKTMWWVLVILIGALIVTVVSLIGMKQKYLGLKNIQNLINSIDILNPEETKKDGFT